MLKSLLEEIAGDKDIHGVAIIDEEGFAIEAFPQGPGLEKMAAGMSQLHSDAVGIAKSNGELDSILRLTLLAEKGNIMAFSIDHVSYLLIHTNSGANVGKIRMMADKIIPRISALL